jgi:hypothetical protein
MSLTIGDNGERYISLGKCRHTPKFKELMSSATLHNHIIDTPWGVSQQIGIWNCKFEVFIRPEKAVATKKFEFTALYTKTFELISYGKTLEENVNIIHAAGIYTRRFNVTKTLNLFIDNNVIEIENNIILPVL